jgi:GT2 family glycosyltransferase
MMQKAVNHAMTSFLTTGGIRGSKSSVEKFKPRSFNMGLSREVFRKTGGFSSMRYGEDIDFSLRIEDAGFKTVLLEDCFVYHKRRTNLGGFYKQVKESGKARIELRDRHPGSLRTVHLFPSAYSLFLLFSLVFAMITMNGWVLLPLCVYWLLIFLEALLKTYNPITSLLAVITSNLMLIGYGYGFIKSWFFRA